MKERKKIPAAERRKLLDQFIEDVEHYAALFRDLAHEMNLKKLENERMMRLCAGEDDEKYCAILDEAYKKNLAAFYRHENDILFSFFFQRPLYAYLYLFNTLGAIDSKEKRMQIFDLHRQFFRDLRVISQSLAVTMEEAALSLKTVSDELQKKAV